MLGLAPAGERAAGARHRGPDRGRRLLVRLRPRGRHRPHRGRSPATALPRTVEVAEPGWLYSFEADAAARGDPRRPAGVRGPGHELGRHARQHARARQVAGRCRPRLRHRARRGAAAHAPRTLPLERRVEAIPRRALAGLERPASVLALGFEDFPDFGSAVDPARRLLRARRQRPRHRLGLSQRPHRGGARRVAARARRARRGGGDRQGRALAAHLSGGDRPAARPRASTGSAPTTSTSTSCTATTRTSRSASSSTRSTPSCGRGGSAAHGAARTGRASASTRRSPTPSGPARRGRPRFPTTSRSPRCSTRSGPAASRPRTTPGRRG